MTTTEISSFGALLQGYRLAAGLSQEALAERAGLSGRAISDLERGQRQAPYPHTVQQLAKALRLSAADRARLEAAVPRRHGGVPRDAAKAGSLGNLPAAVTSFVGRGHELAEVRRLLATTRLLTLTGAGGVGKTRLGVEAARDAHSHYRDGAWLVELAALADPMLVAQAVATTLGVREQPGQSTLETLVSACTTRHLLLLLDNCEHLLDGCAQFVGALLRACPGVQVLAVSREALGIAGEVQWPVPPLGLPDHQLRPTPDHLARCDAIQLFVERAATIRTAFVLTAQNAPAVADICVRLDGIPLALELAAARLTGLTPEQLADRLDQRFRLLTGGNRTAPPRQQTLRAAVDWSYYLLTDAERVLLRRLAVFAGGWTLAAAERVGSGQRAVGSATGEIADALPTEDVLNLLLRLVDQSLVVVDDHVPGGHSEPRYRLLQTVRQYAWERLQEAGEEMDVRGRHRDWCLALAEQAEPALHGPDQVAWLDRLDVEHDNLRAALAWCLAAGEPGGPRDVVGATEAALRLAGGVWWFWYLRHYREGATWLERLLARSQGLTTAARAKVLCAAGMLQSQADDYAGARQLFDESVTLYQSVGDQRGLAYALCQAGHRRRNRRKQGPEYVVGTAWQAEALRLAREVGDQGLIAWVLSYQAGSADKTDPGERTRALAALEESVPLFDAVGDLLGGAAARRHLGEAAFEAGDYERARTAFAADLAVTRALRDTGGMAAGFHRLATVAFVKGDLAGAAAHARDGLALWRAMGIYTAQARGLAELAIMAVAHGQHPAGARRAV